MMQSVDYNQISFLCLAAGFLTLGAFKTFAAFLNALKTKNKKLIRDPKQIEVWLNSYCSFNSSVTYVGLVDETYYYGARLLLNAVSVGLGYLFSLLFLQPFLYSIDVKSPYEYLQKRYGDRIICRIICAINGVIFHVSYSTLFLWSNAIVLSTVFPECNLTTSILVIGSISVFFAICGGLLQSMFVNFFQLLVFLFGALAALGIAIDLSGNKLSEHWKMAKDNERLNFITTGGLSVRYTIWNQLFALPIPWCAFHALLTPNYVRYKQIKSKSASSLFFISHLPIMFIFNAISVFTGIFCYIIFYNCDPFLSKEIINKNQLAPYFLINVLNEKLPSLAGLFLASITVYGIMQHTVGLALSAQLLLNDILKPFFNLKLKKVMKESILLIIKPCVVLFIAVLSIVYALSLQYLNRSIANLFFIFNISINSPVTGLFFLSMFNPYANHVGALSSFVINLAINFWLLIGAMTSKLKIQEFTESTNGCNITDVIVPNPNQIYSPTNETLFYLYSLSPIWYSLFSLLFVLVFGSLFSLLYSLISKKRLDLDLEYKNERKKYLYSFRGFKNLKNLYRKNDTIDSTAF